MKSASAPLEVLVVGSAGDWLPDLRQGLADAGFLVREATAGELASPLLTERLPDLICRPASADGAFSADDDRLAGIALVLFGPPLPPEEAAAAMARGAIDFISPPWDAATLASRFALVARHLRTLSELRAERRLRREAETAAKAAHHARNVLLTSMGREIRTPMTAILGMSHLALQSGLNAKQRNYVEKVERAAEMLLGTLNDILDSSRIDAGALELQPGPFQLDELLASVGRLLALRAEDKGMELLFDVPAGIPQRLTGDLPRLRQILVNLGLDALRSEQQGELVIGIECTDRNQSQATLRFAVRHGGPSGTDGPLTSADFGVTLSRQLLRLMGSELAESPAAPQGRQAVQFEVELALPAGSENEAPSPPRSARTLVVDDNASARDLLVQMCASLGLRAEAARDGWDALRLTSQAQRSADPFELVLLDWKMPGMDGIECAHHLLATHPRPPAILMLTAFGQHDALQQLTSQRVSVRGVLAKPVLPSALGAAVATALQRPERPERGDDRAAPARNETAQLRGARILLVEDNPIIQELALELLSTAGMLVSLAENGREALERLAKQSFDGVLMDCQMPVLDGYEATRALRQMPHLKNLPVIALTANAMEGDRERVLAAGMNDHIAKPLDVALLFETLGRWVHPARPVEMPVAPPVPVSADDPLTRLPGIDAKVGRTSTMNNDKLYRRLLGMFRDGQRDVVAQFRAARSTGDDATAMRLAHNLRAVSASLGALAVQQSAGALERACADKSPESTVAPLLQQVEIDLTPVISGLTLLLPPA